MVKIILGLAFFISLTYSGSAMDEVSAKKKKCQSLTKSQCIAHPKCTWRLRGASKCKNKKRN